MLFNPFVLIMVMVFSGLLFIWLFGFSSVVRSGSTVKSNTTGWDQHSARVLAVEVYRRKPYGWGIRVSYEYEIDGNSYQDRDRVYVRQVFTNRSTAEEMAINYPVGKEVPIRVRPDKATRTEIEETDCAVDNSRVFKVLNGALAGAALVLVTAIILFALAV